MGSSPVYFEKDNLIRSGVRRSSKEFKRGVLIRLEVRRSSKEFKKINLIGLGVRRTLYEFVGCFVSIKSTLFLLLLNY